ncbi:MAG: SsrA-binding protein SmpB [Saprospiraceae bacterium]|nr:SsrA-binding protein SmpB [Saprospiraceae bacterium]
MAKLKNNIEIKNRRAKHEYNFLTKYEAGIMLTGTEVKALREGNANINDAFCYIENSEIYIKNMFISEYIPGTYSNHDPRRLRKLLLTRNELKKLERRSAEPGMTIAPYRLFFSERGFAKIEIYLASGKKSFDKRESIKERDHKRDLDRIKKIYK